MEETPGAEIGDLVCSELLERGMLVLEPSGTACGVGGFTFGANGFRLLLLLDRFDASSRPSLRDRLVALQVLRAQLQETSYTQLARIRSTVDRPCVVVGVAASLISWF